MNEQVVSIACGTDALLGIVTPGAAQADTGVVIVVGGPQYRVGSHRQFVQLARHLGRAGFPTLRFDVRGMGDSPGRAQGFENQGDEIAAAIDALMHQQPLLRRVVLWGLCDGASSALLYLDAHSDTRVAGLVLVNPWVRTEVGEARTRVKHYYLQRLAQREFWLKLLRGQVAVQAARELWRNLRLSRATGGNPSAAEKEKLGYTDRMARAWGMAPGPRLLLMSDTDYTAREFDDHVRASARWQSALQKQPAQRVDLVNADHTCSQPAAQAQLLDATAAFVRRHFGPAVPKETA